MVRYDRIIALSEMCGKKRSFLSQVMGFSSRYLVDAKKQNTNIADKPLRILANELNTTPEYLRGETDDPGIKKAPVQPDGGEEEFMQLFRQLSPEVQERELAYLRQLAAHEAAQDK